MSRVPSSSSQFEFDRRLQLPESLKDMNKVEVDGHLLFCKLNFNPPYPGATLFTLPNQYSTIPSVITFLKDLSSLKDNGNFIWQRMPHYQHFIELQSVVQWAKSGGGTANGWRLFELWRSGTCQLPELPKGDDVLSFFPKTLGENEMPRNGHVEAMQRIWNYPSHNILQYEWIKLNIPHLLDLIEVVNQMMIAEANPARFHGFFMCEGDIVREIDTIINEYISSLGRQLESIDNSIVSGLQRRKETSTTCMRTPKGLAKGRKDLASEWEKFKNSHLAMMEFDIPFAHPANIRSEKP